MEKKRMQGGVAIAVAAVFIVVMVVVVLISQKDATGMDFNGSLIDPPAKAAEISLTRANGEPFRLSDLRGKVVLMYFGYTNCPDYCPSTMVDMRTTFEMLGQDAGNVEFVFITIDPANDSPQRMDEYVTIFNPKFIGLSGTEEELAQTWRDYGVLRDEETKPTAEMAGHESMDMSEEEDHAGMDMSGDMDMGEGEEQIDMSEDMDMAEGEHSAGHNLPSFGGVAFTHTAILYVIDKDGNWRLTLPFGIEPELIVEDVQSLLKE
jgi:cytochrome oxidase Cu insertion factor (SCO1/SenC/PrrC family)